MSKSYDMGNKADMKRFAKDFEKQVYESTQRGLRDRLKDFVCPVHVNAGSELTHFAGLI